MHAWAPSGGAVKPHALLPFSRAGPGPEPRLPAVAQPKAVCCEGLIPRYSQLFVPTSGLSKLGLTNGGAAANSSVPLATVVGPP